MSLDMGSSRFNSPVEFNLLHAMDRALYTILVTDLLRDPLESMQTMAVWLWMEQAVCSNVIKSILSLPYVLINKLADEAVTCLKCICNTQFQFSTEPKEIPLTRCFVKKEISLQYFHENRLIAKSGVSKIVADVCLKAFKDILQEAMGRTAAQKLAKSKMMMISPAVDQSLIYGFSQLGLGCNIAQRSLQVNEVPPDDRAVFVTFSRGHPVYGWEIREFFNAKFGDCIESIHMQRVKPDEQSLHARIVFHAPSIIDLILNEVTKSKFIINGKHVWVRKFVPKHLRCSLLPLLPESLPGSV